VLLSHFHCDHDNLIVHINGSFKPSSLLSPQFHSVVSKDAIFLVKCGTLWSIRRLGLKSSNSGNEKYSTKQRPANMTAAFCIDLRFISCQMNDSNVFPACNKLNAGSLEERVSMNAQLLCGAVLLVVYSIALTWSIHYRSFGFRRKLVVNFRHLSSRTQQNKMFDSIRTSLTENPTSFPESAIT